MGGASSTSKKKGYAIKGASSTSSTPKCLLTVIMLGTAGVGKSTVHKQVARSFGEGESTDQKYNAVTHVRKLFVRTTLDVCEVVAENEEAGSKNNQKTGDAEVDDLFFEHIDELAEKSNDRDMEPHFPEIKKILNVIWNDPIFKKMYAVIRGNVEDKELAMNLDTVDMFSARIDELFQSAFVLSAEEYLKLRQPTTGMLRTIGKFKKKAFELLDVGGQVHYQDEWTGIIAAAKADTTKGLAIIYMVSLDDCGHMETDLGPTKLMRQVSKQGLGAAAAQRKHTHKKCSLMLSLDNWDEHTNSELLAKPAPIPAVLLMNKVDLFRENMVDNPGKFHQTFPEESLKSAEESQADYENRCIRAVRKKFERHYKKSLHGKNSDLSLKWYLTQATDSAMVTHIVGKIIESVTEMNLIAGGFAA